eukprot:4288853-Alexandrium_andersonii.AAC.1
MAGAGRQSATRATQPTRATRAVRTARQYQQQHEHQPQQQEYQHEHHQRNNIHYRGKNETVTENKREHAPKRTRTTAAGTGGNGAAR